MTTGEAGDFVGREVCEKLANDIGNLYVQKDSSVHITRIENAETYG